MNLVPKVQPPTSLIQVIFQTTWVRDEKKNKLKCQSSLGFDGTTTSTVLYPGPDGNIRGTKVIRIDPNGVGFTSMYGSVPESIIPCKIPLGFWHIFYH